MTSPHFIKQQFTILTTVLLFLSPLLLTDAVHGEDTESTALIACDLRCEYQTNPLGIDVEKPRLSWHIESDVRGQSQAAYQILVASSVEQLEQNQGDLWDTGRVDSDETLHIEYEGEPLESGQRCYWKVRSWPTTGESSGEFWSEPACWETAMLVPEDWIAEWINDGRPKPETEEEHFQEDPAPLFRKEFTLTKTVKQARLYITGLGYYDAQINGRPVGNHELDPGWTDYAKRVYYSTFDVTETLTAPPISGSDNLHCIAVSVGNGWYNPLPLRMWGHRVIGATLPTGRPRLIAQLEVEYEDGTQETIATDSTWKVAAGPMLRNSIYLGEIYDARREIVGWNMPDFDDSDWSQVALAQEPVGPLQAQPLAPIRTTAVLKPVAVTEPTPGVFVYDMGQNFGGRIRLNLDVPAGTQLSFRYGELLNEDGTLNPRTSACGQIKGAPKLDETGRELTIWDPAYPSSAWQGDRYIAKGTPGETYENSFTFHTFRYVEVAGYPGTPPIDMLESDRLNSELKQVGRFECSNDMLNEIQEICEWTFLSNVFSVQSDCPHRERFGYGGDLVATCDAFMMNYDMANFYRKTTYDWHDAAREDGMLTDTAPFVGIQYCGVGWAMIHPLMQRKLYQYYGDRRLVEDQYETSKRWLDLVASQNEDHIIKRGLSDHESLTPKPAPPMVTPLYCESARILSDLATILGKDQEADHYADLSRDIRQAWLEQFADEETGVITPDTQAIYAFALYLDMLPQEMRAAALEHLIDDVTVDREGHFSTGIFATMYALDILSREGDAELVYDVVNSREEPGWGYMLENGATTLWEHWALSDNTFSHNHPMFGSVSQWFFNWLGGIQVEPNSVGFDQFSLRPQFVGDLDWVNCSYDSVRGPITCNWLKSDGRIELEIDVPANSTATLYLPVQNGSTVLENGQPIAEAKGVELSTQTDDRAQYRVESGSYHFTILE
jgi:alpha-L-rhamnosidase